MLWEFLKPPRLHLGAPTRGCGLHGEGRTSAAAACACACKCHWGSKTSVAGSPKFLLSSVPVAPFGDDPGSPKIGTHSVHVFRDRATEMLCFPMNCKLGPKTGDTFRHLFWCRRNQVFCTRVGLGSHPVGAVFQKCFHRDFQRRLCGHGLEI